MNSSIQSIKRYHIAKVYRRDQPAMTKGRMREFYQCDFDIAGSYDPMLPDAEILRITTEIFEGLGWKGNYTIKINHRKLLDGIFAVCGVPTEKTRTISSAVDKLDKSPWEEVKREMTEEKGLDPEIADKIGEYIKHKGGQELLTILSSDPALSSNESAKKGIEDLSLLFTYLATFNILSKISLDMSLARGLDYYTGLIYEVVTEGSSAPVAQVSNPAQQHPNGKDKPSGKKQKKAAKPGADDDDRSNDPSVGVGSVAAGGRYDELVAMFSPRKTQIPCVGISFGVERIFSIVKSRMAAASAAGFVRSNEVDVYVMAFGRGEAFTGLLHERMEICRQLWDAGIKAEFTWKTKAKLQSQFKSAEQGGVPFAVILGEDELAAGKVKVKEMGLPEGHAEKDGVEVEKSSMVEEIKTRLKKKAEQDMLDGLSGGLDGLNV